MDGRRKGSALKLSTAGENQAVAQAWRALPLLFNRDCPAEQGPPCHAHTAASLRRRAARGCCSSSNEPTASSAWARCPAPPLPQFC